MRLQRMIIQVRANMSQLGQGSNSRLPTQNDNEFLPAGPSSYNQASLIHEQRRSLLLGNEDFFPMNSSLSAKQAGIEPETSSKHQESLGAFSSKNQRIFQPQPEAQDEQNQFMLDHNSLAASINQGLTGQLSNLDSKITSNNPHLDFRNESNYFPQEGSRLNNIQSKNNPLASEVEEYHEKFGVNMDSSRKNEEQSKIERLNESERIKQKELIEEKQFKSKDNSLSFGEKGQDEANLQEAFQMAQSSFKQQLSQQSDPLNQPEDINMASSHHSFSSKHKIQSNLSKQRQLIDEQNNFGLQSNKQLFPENSNIASELKSLQPIASHQMSGHISSKSNAEPLEFKQNDFSGLIKQELNEISCNQPDLDILKGVSKLDSKALQQMEPSKQSIRISQKNRQQKSGEVLVCEAKSSIINRIVVDPESLEKISNSQAFIQQSAPQKEQEESVNRDLLESQVIKYNRSNHEISMSNIQSRQAKDTKDEGKQQQWKDIELNQNDSRFLQPIEDSIRQIQNKALVQHVQSQHQAENLRNQTTQPIPGQSLQPHQQSAHNHNLSNIILEPCAANSAQNSQNIELDSSAPKKQGSIKNSSFASQSQGNRYQQSLSEFKRNQIRKLQERSSIDHLQSNFSEVRSKTNTEDNRQEHESINEFEHSQSKKGGNSLKESDIRHQTRKSIKTQGSNLKERSQLQIEEFKRRQIQMKNRRKEDEVSQQAQRKQPTIYQYNVQSKNSSQVNGRQQNLSQRHENIQQRVILQKEIQDYCEAHQNQSYSSKLSDKKHRNQNIIYKRSEVSSNSKHSQADLNSADLIENEGFNNNFLQNKQETQTGNLLVEKRDQSSQQNMSALKKSSNESNKISKQSQKNRNSYLYDLQTPEKEVKIFNSFPQELNQEQKYSSEPREHDKNPIMTPNSKGKFQRLPREKLYSQKEYLHTQSKKERNANRRESREDQIERIKALKQAQKKRLEKQLEKVSKELEEINQKEKKVERIYESMQRMEEEQKTPKVSSHQSRHRKESEQFLKMIKQHRKLKEQQQLQFEDIDRNITNNLMELNKIRQETEDRKKEKKRIQIIERMKKNQLRRMNEMKQAKANNQYVNQFKAQPHQSPQVPKSPPRQDYPSSLNQIKRPSKQQQRFLLNAGSKPIKEQPHKSSKVTSIRSLHKKRQEDKYETRLD